MKYISETLILLSGLSLAGAVVVAMPEIGKPTPIAQAISSGEIRSIRTGSGETWAIVSLWDYQFHPEIVPNLDLKSVLEVKADTKNSVILLESDPNKEGDRTPKRGWYLIRESGFWQLRPLDKSFESQYPEIFRKRSKS